MCQDEENQFLSPKALSLQDTTKNCCLPVVLESLTANFYLKKGHKLGVKGSPFFKNLYEEQRATKINQERNFSLYYPFQRYLLRKQNQSTLKCLLDVEKLACAESIRKLFNNSLP